MPSKRHKLYVGRSGQLAVVAEFIMRGYNVAIPEIDIGEDIFVIEDGKQGYYSIQVKTGRATEQRNGTCYASFNVPINQLKTPTNIDLSYVFLLRKRGHWDRFIVIPRVTLAEFYDHGDLGMQKGDSINLRIVFGEQTIKCRKVDFTPFNAAWETKWPDIL